ncbi:MAG: TIGR01459 family HAD-type hydrolase [Rickettsiales bacterium]
MSLNSKKISGYKDLSNLFDIFIFDLCGVVHDGVSLHEGTVEFIEYLRTLKKDVILLSNSPNFSSKAKNFLNSNNFKIKEDEVLLTSGDYFYSVVRGSADYKNKKYFYFGGERNRESLVEMGLEITADPASADYIIASPFSDDKKEIEDYSKLVEELVKYGKEYLCINPDIYAPHGNTIRYTPGFFAKLYEELGGKVKYFGKPEKSIYQHVIGLNRRYESAPKDRIIMIGDSMNTDIRGANNFAISSLLVGKGYHKEIDFTDENKMESLFKEYGFEPTYYIEQPKF